MSRAVTSRIGMGVCIVLVLGLVQAPAAQTLESEVRTALAREQGRGITHADARGILRSRDAVVRGIDRDRRLAAAYDAFGAGLDSRHAAAARGRLRADNGRLEEANRRLDDEIAAERERRRLRWIRWAIEIPVTVAVTTVTGSPIIGSAVAGGVSTAVTGGVLDDVAIATFTRAATAGAHHVVGLGVDHVATAVGDSVAASVADRLAVYRLHPVVVKKATQEVAAKVARTADYGLRTLVVRVLPDEDPGSAALNRFSKGLGVVNVALPAQLYRDCMATPNCRAAAGYLVEQSVPYALYGAGKIAVAVGKTAGGMTDKVDRALQPLLEDHPLEDLEAVFGAPGGGRDW